MLVLEPVEPLDLVIRGEMRLSLSWASARKSSAWRRWVAASSPPASQQLSGELPNGLEHAEPRLAVTHLDLADQTVVDQGGQPVQRVDAEITLGVADRFDGLEAGAAPEDRQPGEQSLLGFRQAGRSSR